jgi:large subunit ribosomal protein L13
MNTTTKSTKVSEIKRSWILVDVKDQVLGRAATGVAAKLMGKGKPNFVRNLDCGDYVVVINAAHVVTTGRKEKEKLYGKFSGYPGGLKQKALWQVRQEKPTEPMRHAVWGMLPTNKLRDRLVTRLYIYPEAIHPYKDKFVTKK